MRTALYFDVAGVVLVSALSVVMPSLPVVLPFVTLFTILFIFSQTLSFVSATSFQSTQYAIQPIIQLPATSPENASLAANAPAPNMSNLRCPKPLRSFSRSISSFNCLIRASWTEREAFAREEEEEAAEEGVEGEEDEEEEEDEVEKNRDKPFDVDTSDDGVV